MNISQKKFLVLGLGRSGLAAVKWLQKHEAYVMVYDRDHSILEHTCTVFDVQPFPTAPTLQIWADVSGVIQSPGIACNDYHLMAAHRYNVPIYSDADLFCMAYPDAQIIGITGTNGKTTTTHLLTHILNASGVHAVMGGNVGVPILSHAFNPETWYVWELSSYQLEISQRLNLTYVGWLNISSDHLERHQTMQAYVTAKEKILLPSTASGSHNRHQPQGVIVAEDTWSQGVAERHPHLHQVQTQTSDYAFPDTPVLRGPHNMQNMCVASDLAKMVGVNHAAIREAVLTFPGVEHRQEIVATLEGVTFINDSKATNVDAVEKALAAQARVVWIAGGEPKSESVRSLAPYLSKVSKAYLIGRAAASFAGVLAEHNIPYVLSGTLEQAVPAAFQWAKQDSVKTILFSPACASFDQFRDFEHRGRVFKACVHKLGASLSPPSII